MHWVTIFACVLAACGPLLVEAQNKMIFVIPRIVRRAHPGGSPWRQFTRPPFTKATKFLDHEFLPSQRGPPHHHHKYFTKGRPLFHQSLPHGGDDFDQGHEDVNHVMIPHGKGISHTLTFGHGYVPHEALKDHAGFSAAPGPFGSHEDVDLSPYMTPPEVTQQADNYLQQEGEDEEANLEEIQERRTDDYNKAKHLLTKSVVKNFAKTYFEPSKKPYFSESAFSKEKSVLIPRGIPDVTLGGSKEGIILRDTVDLGNYHQKLLELTKTWPAALSGSPHSSAIPQGSIPSIASAAQQISSPFQSSGFNSASLLSAFSQAGQQGYAVKEDVDDIPHDFRRMPIQTAPPPTPDELVRSAVPQIQTAVQQGSQPQFSDVQYSIPDYHGFLG